MIRLDKFQVMGFKSLTDLEVRPSCKNMFLIGTNGSGKSSVLQALAFVRYFVQGQPQKFFDDRRWVIGDIRPKLSSNSKSSLYYMFKFNREGQIITWRFQWNINSSRLSREEIAVYEKNKSNKENIVDYDFYKIRRSNENSLFSGLKIIGSTLSVVEPARLSVNNSKILQEILDWALGITSLELLSPSSMRQSGRASTDMGVRGERLAGFLANIGPQGRERVLKRVKKVYKLANIETTVKRAGWVELMLAEQYSSAVRFSSNHMSDGFMRVLAFCTIPELGKKISLILLDEVEDGVEPHILPDLIRSVLEESSAQFLMTSHSPTLVNYFEASEITFICRDIKGVSIAASLNELESFQTGGEYFGNGELWVNFDVNKIVEEVRELNQKKVSVATGAL